MYGNLDMGGNFFVTNVNDTNMNPPDTHAAIAACVSGGFIFVSFTFVTKKLPPISKLPYIISPFLLT